MVGLVAFHTEHVAYAGVSDHVEGPYLDTDIGFATNEVAVDTAGKVSKKASKEASPSFSSPFRSRHLDLDPTYGPCPVVRVSRKRGVVQDYGERCSASH